MFSLKKSVKLPLAILTATFLLGNVSLQAECCGKSKPIVIIGQAAPEVKRKVRTNHPFPYRQVYQNLTKNGNIATLDQDLINLYIALAQPGQVGAEEAYQKLLSDALSIVNNYCPAQSPDDVRVVVTATNGMVIVDTEQGSFNTLANFLAGLIGENFNSRIAILDALLWPAGVGLETQFNFNNFRNGSSVAIRLGPYLSGQGTVRLTIFH